MKKKQKPILHEFDLGIYPRKLWIAISKDSFKNKLYNIPDFNENYFAETMDTYDKKTGDLVDGLTNTKKTVTRSRCAEQAAA